MNGDQIPFLPGRKSCQMPGACTGGGGGEKLKLWFDWHIMEIEM